VTVNESVCVSVCVGLSTSELISSVRGRRSERIITSIIISVAHTLSFTADTHTHTHTGRRRIISEIRGEERQETHEDQNQIYVVQHYTHTPFVQVGSESDA